MAREIQFDAKYNKTKKKCLYGTFSFLNSRARVYYEKNIFSSKKCTVSREEHSAFFIYPEKTQATWI